MGAKWQVWADLANPEEIQEFVIISLIYRGHKRGPIKPLKNGQNGGLSYTQEAILPGPLQIDISFEL